MVDHSNDAVKAMKAAIETACFGVSNAAESFFNKLLKLKAAFDTPPLKPTLQKSADALTQVLHDTYDKPKPGQENKSTYRP